MSDGTQGENPFQGEDIFRDWDHDGDELLVTRYPDGSLILTISGRRSMRLEPRKIRELDGAINGRSKWIRMGTPSPAE